MILRRIAPLLCALLLAVPLAAQLPPDARWRTTETEHFRIHYTEGLDTLARRAADRAEAAHAALSEILVRAPRGKIDLVVSDNVDYSNGYATPLPTNRVVVFAHPPIDTPELGFYDDWLQLVVSHELAHIFHLDYAEGIPRLTRRVFGRTPFGFPNAFTPPWTTEGLATVLESRLTRAGRVRATLHDMVLRTAILEDEFFSIDQASGHPVSWPAGNTRYVYGSMFMDWLGDRYGHDRHAEWVKSVGERLPYLAFMDRSAKDSYGPSFTRAWREWRDSLTVGYSALADSLRRAGLTEPQVLSAEGRRTEAPRWSPDGRTIAFAQGTGRSENGTRLWSEAGGIRVLAPRTSLGPSGWRADGSLVTAMLESNDPYRDFSDLYLVRPDGGRERLTRGARLLEPDVHAATGRIVAIRGGGGTNVPVVVSPDGREVRPLVPASLDVHWTRPRWSPNGEWIAIARWRPGALYDIVVLEAATGRVLREITADRAVDTSPAWSPDGRYVVFSSDRTGISNLYAFDLQRGELRQVSNVLTGAFDPDVSPDGRWIAMTLYRADGYHLARMPFDPASWRAAPPLRAEFRQPGATPEVVARTAGGPSRPYRAAPSLRPAAWTPVYEEDDSVLGTGFGAAVGGTDVVGRHAYGASATYYTATRKLAAGVGYLYSGLGNPTVGASATQSWDGFRIFREDGLNPTGSPTSRYLLLERERTGSLVATFTRPRFRSFRWLSLGAAVRDNDFEFLNEPPADLANLASPVELGAVATLGISTTRRYEYSVSPENGVVAAASVEGGRYLGEENGEAFGGYLRTTGRLQTYIPVNAFGYARHVLALRGVGAADMGSVIPGYSLGGLDSEVSASPLSTFVQLSNRLDLPVRGYPEGTQRGDRAVAATAEYRFPLVLVERGYRVLPVYLDRLWGAVFTDAGTAWCVESCEVGGERFGDPRPAVSVGAELGINLSILYSPPFPLRFGFGVPLTSVYTNDDLTERFRPGPLGYFAIGTSF